MAKDKVEETTPPEKTKKITLDDKDEEIVGYLKMNPLGIDGKSVSNQVQLSLSDTYTKLNALAAAGLVRKGPDWYMIA